MLKYHRQHFRFQDLGANNIDRLQLEMIPPDSSVLEIGCATGPMAEYLEKEKHCRVTGVELDAKQAAVAASRCTRVITGGIDDPATRFQLDRLVAESGRFDLIFMSQVVEHLAEPEDSLRKLHDWLLPDGALVISTCNVAHWKSRLRLLRGIWKYEEYGVFDRGHLRFFTPASFTELIAACDFRIIADGYSFEDICPCKLLFDKRLLAPSDLLRLIPLVGNSLRQRYVRRLRNLISTQFVFKAVRSLNDVA
jgi:methionine biosynthesis protein MetW